MITFQTPQTVVQSHHIASINVGMTAVPSQNLVRLNYQFYDAEGKGLMLDPNKAPELTPENQKEILATPAQEGETLQALIERAGAAWILKAYGLV